MSERVRLAVVEPGEVLDAPSLIDLDQIELMVVFSPRLMNLTLACALPGAVSLIAMSKEAISQSWASMKGSKSSDPTSCRRAARSFVLGHQGRKLGLEVPSDGAIAGERRALGVLAFVMKAVADASPAAPRVRLRLVNMNHRP
jgi:hypothetical protein